MQTCPLKLWQDKEIFQDMEGPIMNLLDTPVENQDVEISQDLEAQHHTKYILKPSV